MVDEASKKLKIIKFGQFTRAALKTDHFHPSTSAMIHSRLYNVNKGLYFHEQWSWFLFANINVIQESMKMNSKRI